MTNRLRRAGPGPEKHRPNGLKTQGVSSKPISEKKIGDWKNSRDKHKCVQKMRRFGW